MINIKGLKYATIISSIFMVFLLVSFIFNANTNYDSSGDNNKVDENYENELFLKYQEVSKKVIPYIVNAKVQIDNKQYIGQVLEDKGNGKTYHITINNESNWYDNYLVSIIDIKPFTYELLLDNEIEIFVNFSSFDITSDYFIWVDLYRIQTYILKKQNNYFKLIKRFDCSTGANITPTKRGFYKITGKGTHFYSRDNTYICYNYLQYSGSYLLHSFPYSLDKEVLDDRLNQRVSNGCVRFDFETSKYLYDFIPIGTNIWLN